MHEARSKIVLDIIGKNIDAALAATIAITEHTVRIRRITAMAHSPVSILVGFHDVELGAEVTSNLICITVLKRVNLVVDCWHQNCVQSCEATTAHLT